MSGGLQSSGRMFIKSEGAGRMLPTLPRQVRRASVPLMLRGYATCFKPSPGVRRTGAFVLATAGTKPGASDKGASAAPRA